MKLHQQLVSGSQHPDGKEILLTPARMLTLTLIVGLYAITVNVGVIVVITLCSLY